jgi:hypothetical protein
MTRRTARVPWMHCGSRHGVVTAPVAQPEGVGERQRAGGRGPKSEGERQRAGGRGSKGGDHA